MRAIEPLVEFNIIDYLTYTIGWFDIVFSASLAIQAHTIHSEQASIVLVVCHFQLAIYISINKRNYLVALPLCCRLLDNITHNFLQFEIRYFFACRCHGCRLFCYHIAFKYSLIFSISQGVGNFSVTCVVMRIICISVFLANFGFFLMQSITCPLHTLKS